MTSSPTTGETSDVPARVFEKFLQALGGTDVSPDVVARLRRGLLEDEKYTERALKEADLSEEALT